MHSSAVYKETDVLLIMEQNSVSTVRGSPPNGIYGRHAPLPTSAAWYVS